MMTDDLLLEIGSDEIPARYLLPAIEDLRVRAEQAFENARLSCKEVASYGTPRRLVLYVKELSAFSSDVTVKVRGPSKRVAYDSEGMPTKALLGFCRSLGIEPSDVSIEQENNGEYVYGLRHDSGKPVSLVLQEVIPDVVMGMNCPYPLRWGKENWKWFRPIRWVVCLYGKEVVPMMLAGVASGRTSYGQRTLHPGSIEIPSAYDYFHTIADAGVIIDHDLRRQIIADGAESLSREIGGLPVDDQDLLDEVTSLCEHPSPFRGEFSSRYLELPKDVLITVMRHHQRYFPILDGLGKVLPGFVGVRDGSPDMGMDNVRKGNEWVLKARLEDASFFYAQDIKVRLEERLPELERVYFLGEAGTLYDKTMRLERLSAYLGEKAGLSERDTEMVRIAARLSKCDLVTLMVRELPELEGVMGGHYARIQGVNEDVARAISQQYLPKGANGKLPDKGISGILSISDKLDTLAVAFCLGVGVSGSQDPLGLRRAASGIASVILSHGYDIDLDDAIMTSMCFAKDAAEKAGKAVEDIDSACARLKQFLLSRVEVHLSERGYPIEVIKSVLAGGENRISRFPAMVEAIMSILGSQTLADVVTGWRRTSVLGSKASGCDISPELLVEDQEKTLYALLMGKKSDMERYFEQGDYGLYLEELSSLRVPIDNCLDNVLIMSEDERLKENRIKLLGVVSRLFTRFADFSYILPLLGKL